MSISECLYTVYVFKKRTTFIVRRNDNTSSQIRRVYCFVYTNVNVFIRNGDTRRANKRTLISLNDNGFLTGLALARVNQSAKNFEIFELWAECEALTEEFVTEKRSRYRSNE